MFDNIGRAAEQVATSVSRRGFLGSLGGWAAAAAMGVAGMLTTAGSALATNGKLCCFYGVPGCCLKCVKKHDGCPATGNGFPLYSSFTTSTCHACLGFGCGPCIT